MRQGEYRGNL
uniref:Uncharacterized protein n=1 Tax=Arundo donax TaxID=35708 RepID=A0A0A8Z630_ARUDO